MSKVTLNVKGMTCSACQAGLEKYLRKQDGIFEANVNLVLAQVTIEYDEKLTLEDLERFIEEAGFESAGIFNEKELKKEEKQSKWPLIIFGIFAFITFYIAMAHMFKFPIIKYLNLHMYPKIYSLSLLVLAVCFLVYGFDILKSGLKNALHKTPNMDTLVSLGVIVCFIYSFVNLVFIFKGQTQLVNNLYFESTALIIYFIKLGRVVDKSCKEKTKEALKELVQITPSKALLKVKDGCKEVTIDEIKENDILICKPGMKIAVDGVVTNGVAHVDEAFITGESIPNKKAIKDKVVAGSINLDGYIEYKAVKIGKDSTISEIVRLVIEATGTKAPIQKLADKVSAIFVPSIIIIAFLTLIFYILIGSKISVAITFFVTVLVVACPCSLGLATPLAVVISLGKCAKKGILIKTSSILENIDKVDTIVFDKTGTLTYGNLQIDNVINKSTFSDREFLIKIASLEINSSHPIATAFKNYVNKNNFDLYKVDDFENIPGIGLKGNIGGKEIYVGSERLITKLKIKEDKFLSVKKKELENVANTLIYLIEDKEILGLVGITDIVREEALETIKKLKMANKNIYMLTGDNKYTANVIAKKLGINNVKAEVLPKEKTDFIKNLLKNGKNVMMVGDGINDAPSLATSNVGVSFNSGTDIAADSADIILMNNSLSNINSLLDISKKTLKIIKQNLFWAFFYNVCMIPIAAGAFSFVSISMNPMLASISMVISSLTVLLNSLRLR